VGFLDGLAAERAVMVRHGDARKSIWITEFGYSTCTSRPPCVSEATQACYVREFFAIAARVCYVKAASWYNLRGTSNGPEDWTNREEMFGVVHNNFSDKPGARAMRAAFARLRHRSGDA
jgi:hypothetical protein